MRFLLTAAFVCICAPAWAESYGPFEGVLYHRCYDGDTCTFSIQALHPLIGEKINVRIRGIDTPEIRGKCEGEKNKAILARDFLVALMNKARSMIDQGGEAPAGAIRSGNPQRSHPS